MRKSKEDHRPSDRFSFGKLVTAETSVYQDGMGSGGDQYNRTRMDLQKSLQMLDEAVGTPGPLLRSAKKTPVTRKSNFYTPGKKGVMDMSSVLPGTPGFSMYTPGSASSRHHSLNYSHPSNIQTRLEEMEEEDMTTNVGLLMEEDPGLAASSSVFGNFKDAVRTKVADHQVFDLLEDYEEICNQQVSLLKRLLHRTTPGQSKLGQVKSVLNTLTEEKFTWRLISDLYRDRLETELRADDEPMLLETLGNHLSDKQLVEILYEKDSKIRQAQLVVDWLEKNAKEDLDSYYDKVEFFCDQSGAWENTLHTLQQQSSRAILGQERQMVTELDPDAPFRQNKPLADLDQEDDVRLLKYIFACVRAGKLEEAQKLCNRCGQPWRAATLEGWRLFHDPNYTTGGSTVQSVEGNPYRDVWKAACWKMSEEEGFNVFERAIYAALSGNLRRLLPACQSWADYLWAYGKVLIDTRMEQEVRINSNTLDRSLEELPKSYWDKVMSMESVFKDIQASANEDVQNQAKQRFQLIQKYIILGDIDALVEEMFEWVRDCGADLPPHLIRFMTHLILFFRTIGINTKDELGVTVIVAYVKYLIEDKNTELIATFVSKLPQDLQVEWYAKYLEGVRGTEERQTCLQLAEESGLDVTEITKLVVENIRSQEQNDYPMDSESAPLDSGITEEDQLKVDAIEWLVFNPSQRAEAMRQANAVMRTFLVVKKHSAARAVFNKIPPHSIDSVVRAWQAQTGSKELCPEDSNAIREYLCIGAYLDAQDSFNDWFEHFHNSRPERPEMPQGASFTERVAYEHREKQYQAEYQRWQYALKEQSQRTEDKIYNVLLFPDGGWLVDQLHESPQNETRQQQMVLLRQMCLPSLCFLLHKVLHATGEFQKCLQLADVIASEQYQLYSVFNKDDLQKLLQCLKDSAVENLNKNLDPLGYTIS